jgi:excisionase family DNA binding protein
MSRVHNVLPALLRPPEAAAYLGIGETRLRELTNEGKIHWIDLSGGDKRKAVRFHRADLDAFIEASRKQATPCPSINLKIEIPTPTTLNSGVIDFEALRMQRQNEKPSQSRSASKKRSSSTLPGTKPPAPHSEAKRR